MDTASLDKIEFEVEDDIYKMLRNEFIITNNSAMSLFSIPRNQRFVYINTDRKIRSDPLNDSIKYLTEFIEKFPIKNFETDENDDEEFDNFRPFKGFAKPWKLDKKVDDFYEKQNERNILSLLNQHIDEALEYGFDDSMSKYQGKSHFVVRLNCNSKERIFTLIHDKLIFRFPI